MTGRVRLVGAGVTDVGYDGGEGCPSVVPIMSFRIEVLSPALVVGRVAALRRTRTVQPNTVIDDNQRKVDKGTAHLDLSVRSIVIGSSVT